MAGIALYGRTDEVGRLLGLLDGVGAGVGVGGAAPCSCGARRRSEPSAGSTSWSTTSAWCAPRLDGFLAVTDDDWAWSLGVNLMPAVRGALRYRVSGPDLLRAQLTHLLEITERPG